MTDQDLNDKIGCMKLKALVHNIPDVVVKGSKEISITGMTAHSRQVAPGNLFIAKRGKSADGLRFIPEAVAAGAIAIACDIYDPFLQGVVQIIHPNIAALEPLLAKRYFVSSSSPFSRFGITGTNGKTTTSYLIRHLIEDKEELCGLIGTLEWLVGGRCFPSLQTTPDVITNHRLLYEMQLAGCRSAVMEVSSHGLDQGRVQEIDFDVAVFTNLTRDHLDYHKTVHEYLAAKAKLFTGLKKSAVAVVNSDDPFTDAVLQECKAQPLFYGLGEKASVRAKNIRFSAEGAVFEMDYEGRSFQCKSPLIGRHNLYNCLAALSVCLSQGRPLEDLVLRLQSFPGVAGRMERVKNTLGLHVFVDYAHTEDALRNVLLSLQEIKKGRILTVFGCGGDRDSGKRPAMGAVAAQLSDEVFITSDNPRTEDPCKIIQEILVGIQKPVHVQPDRKKAIEEAIFCAHSGDIILIAGKGHETQQIYSHQVCPFDDRLIAHEACMGKQEV